MVTKAQDRLLAAALRHDPSSEMRLVRRAAVDMTEGIVEAHFDVRLSSRAIAQIVAATIASWCGGMRRASNRVASLQAANSGVITLL